MAIALAASSGFVVGCGGSGAGANDASKAHGLVGHSAPVFDLPTQVGSGRASLNDERGKVVLVDFWATWCEPCKKSFPHYQALIEELDGLSVIGISVDDEPDAIASFAKETGVSFPLAWDRNKEVVKKYEPQSMPTSFLIDQNGIVRRIYEGYHAGDEKRVEADVKHLLE